MLDAETVKNAMEFNTFSVYPNPLSGEIYIDLKKNVSRTSCEVFNLKGQLVKEQTNLWNRNTISLDSLPSGTYTIRVTNEKNIVIKKILKL